MRFTFHLKKLFLKCGLKDLYLTLIKPLKKIIAIFIASKDIIPLTGEKSPYTAWGKTQEEKKLFDESLIGKVA